MTTVDGAAATFRIGLIQMRAGRTPAANLDAATKLIGEAKASGADYVQTPEMTNILEARRDALMAAIRPEDFPGSRGEPRLSHRPEGRDRRPLRQDPHV